MAGNRSVNTKVAKERKGRKEKTKALVTSITFLQSPITRHGILTISTLRGLDLK